MKTLSLAKTKGQSSEYNVTSIMCDKKLSK